jgi:hypothetical protein
MQKIEQSEYFNRRAEEEREAADKASDERSAQPHRELADRYDAKAKDEPEADEQHSDGPQKGMLPKDFSILP